MRQAAKQVLRHALGVPPPPAMSVDNVYAYLDALWQKRRILGPVVEVGVASGGTTILARQFLRRIGVDKPYVCVDTFSGFVQQQLATDHRLGLSVEHDDLSRSNSMRRFDRTLRRAGVAAGVTTIRGDVCQMQREQFPAGISVALVDVDLRDPVYAALELLYSQMAPGGLIVVDDCKAGTSWVGADQGYQDFCNEHGVASSYYMGFGVVEAQPLSPNDRIDWALSSHPNPVVPS